MIYLGIDENKSAANGAAKSSRTKDQVSSRNWCWVEFDYKLIFLIVIATVRIWLFEGFNTVWDFHKKYLHMIVRA